MLSRKVYNTPGDRRLLKLHYFKNCRICRKEHFRGGGCLRFRFPGRYRTQSARNPGSARITTGKEATDMNSNWKNIINGVLYSFRGGVYPDEHKSGTSGLHSVSLGIPETLVIPLRQHSGRAAEVLVKPGQHVLRNEPLTSPANDRHIACSSP